ncbi:MAG: protein kinase domain-containing protein [Planctomycetota bacterium]|jgi:TolB-like protein/Tfp pilus assembly protein PilF
MALDKGTKLGPYEVLAPIGAGGMGEVYRARDTKLRREVAIKVLPADVASSPERLQRFEREATTVASLNHPNIVTIFGIEESNDHRYIAMELVEGESLDRKIAQGGMPLARIFDIAIPVADALAAAHDKGIVHRDLKPANVMVTNEDRVKVLDFGLAKLAAADQGGSSPDDMTMSAPITGRGVIIGTVPYMSPEQLKSKPVDHRSDIFSLGIMLYEMASGTRPFTGDDSATVMSAILRDTPRPVQELNSVLPRHLGRIVARCLKKNPEERYQTAKDVRNELRELRKEMDSGSDLSESQPVSVQASVAPPPSSTSSPSLSGSALSAPTRRGEFWIGVVAVIVAIGAGAWWLGRDDSVANNGAVVGDSSQGSGQASVGSAATPSTEDSLRPSDQPARASITLAVLPFKNLGSPDDEYFSDGISDEIRGRLAKVRKLGVISRSSAFQYKDTDKTNRQIGSELGVDYLIDGTIRWDKRGGGAGRVRITPELIRISDDMSLWSQPYDRQTEDIFEVQSDIAAQVLNQLQITLLEPERRGIEGKPTENSDAYHAYLRGLVYWGETDFTEEKFRQAIQMFERATSLDPSFALAYSHLSEAHSHMHHFGFDSTEDRANKAKAAVDRALEIQPDLPEAYVALGVYYYECHRDYDRALEAYHTAQKDLPHSSEVLDGIGYVLRRQGRHEEALGFLKRAFDANPLNPLLPNNIATTCGLLERFPEAESWYDLSISLAPDQALAYQSKAWMYLLWHGDTERSRATLSKMTSKRLPYWRLPWHKQEILERDFQAALDRLASIQLDSFSQQLWFRPKAQVVGLVYRLMGKWEQSRVAYESARVLLEDKARNRPDDHRIHSSLGIVYAGLGRKEDAIRHGKRGLALFPVQKDAMLRPHREEDMALIYTMVGELDLALDRLEYLLSVPSQLISIQLLRIDPRWDALRDHPRYQSLMRKHGFEPEPQPAGTIEPTPNKKMLAVLPFANLSGDPEQEYFSDGMTEEMITRLGRLRPELLGVIARTSAMRYRKTDKLIDQIGQELGVAYVIEGGVRRAGSSVRINAQLIQVSDQTQLWGDSYTRDLADVFAVQAEVAEAVAKALAVELLSQDEFAEAATPTGNSAAYDAYLRGRSYWAKRTPESLYTAIDHFKHAIKLEPNYALAYSGLADAWAVLPWYVPGPYQAMNAEASKAAEKALALDDSLAEAHVSMAKVLAEGGEQAFAERHYRRAVEIDPNNATAHQWYGSWLAIDGQYNESVEAYEKAITLNPLSAVMRKEYSGGMLLQRRFDKAIEQAERALALQPKFFNAALDLVWAQIGKENLSDAAGAFAVYLELIGQPPENVAIFRRTFEASGLGAGIVGWLDSQQSAVDLPGLRPAKLAQFFAWTDENDRAFEWLDNAIERQDPFVVYAARHFAFDNLHDDPRWNAFLRKAGIPKLEIPDPARTP